MQDTSRCPPTPKPREAHPNLVGMHRGWTAAQNGEPLDPSESAAFRVGWHTWQEAQIARAVRRLRRQARSTISFTAHVATQSRAPIR